uniref:Oligodendrocyte myelin glycoprotein n=1 Tax=Scleropages formosus TaxID=113540 RepID=A0A8C9SYD9_SCLFO
SYFELMPAGMVLLLLLFGARVLAVCPPMCSCFRGHREADCSGRGLAQLPDSLQHNIRTLNLSHNRLRDLDSRLSHFAHLRTLDVSHNQLVHLPTGLPRALWHIRASGNRLQYLEKNDTAYHWNLQTLDLSSNELERVVFINNTLPGLLALNLSHNKFWTVPTNMPSNLETVDLSHNFLVQVLPGSLDRLSRLTHFYLHSNRFLAVDGQVFSRLESLRLITLYDNPWACEDEENMSSLQAWMESSSAQVQGCPCSTRHVCGEAHRSGTGGWHFALYTEPPLGADARHASRPPMQAVTSVQLSKSVPLDSALNRSDEGAMGHTSPAGYEPASSLGPLTSTPHSVSPQTSTTVRIRSAKKAKPGAARSTCQRLGSLAPQTLAANLILAATVLRNV